VKHRLYPKDRKRVNTFFVFFDFNGTPKKRALPGKGQDSALSQSSVPSVDAAVSAAAR
jgi:hypothetical protein